MCRGAIEDHLRRLFQLNRYIGGADRQLLAGTYIKWHAGPTPGVDVQSQCGECLHLRVRRHTLVLPVPSELASNDIGYGKRTDGLEEPKLFITQRFRVRF